MFSCELGAVKPEPAIYEHLIRISGLQPSQIFFIDDKPENVRAATIVGIFAKVYTTYEAFKRNLDVKLPLPP